ncbi:glucokinase [Campylobacter jejuni]|nr:glucokinase [Campylobacter jejuni]EHN6902926.1 glucokinase [Campylobacter jejuni]EHN6916882.1 glucokinase [Campylobacter jejuni]
MSISQNRKSYPRLLADIGGTNARFALEVQSNIIKNIEIFPCNDYNTVVDAVKVYLNKVGNPAIKYGAFAIANPVVGDWVQMTNHHWAFSIETTRQALNLEVLILINDFTAQAYAISRMSSSELIQIGGNFCAINAPKAVLGPGTGLGVSGLIPCGNGDYIALSGEGGHTSFSPFDDTEVMIWQYAKKKYGHVSTERFLSGSGLVLIYEALADREGIKSVKISPEIISGQALSGKSPLCRLTLDIFCAMLGTISADLALTLGARGGVYLCGGIIPRFIDYFKTSPFRVRFENKGRLDAYLAAIPVYVVLAKYPGIFGVAVALENHLKDYFSKK